MYKYGRFQIEYNYPICHQYSPSFFIQSIIFHQNTSVCDQNPGQPCSIKASEIIVNRLRCLGGQPLLQTVGYSRDDHLHLGSSTFSLILCQQIANELEISLPWTGNSLKYKWSNFIYRESKKSYFSLIVKIL